VVSEEVADGCIPCDVHPNEKGTFAVCDGQSVGNDVFEFLVVA